MESSTVTDIVPASPFPEVLEFISELLLKKSDRPLILISPPTPSPSPDIPLEIKLFVRLMDSSMSTDIVPASPFAEVLENINERSVSESDCPVILILPAVPSPSPNRLVEIKLLLARLIESSIVNDI